MKKISDKELLALLRDKETLDMITYPEKVYEREKTDDELLAMYDDL